MIYRFALWFATELNWCEFMRLIDDDDINIDQPDLDQMSSYGNGCSTNLFNDIQITIILLQLLFASSAIILFYSPYTLLYNAEFFSPSSSTISGQCENSVKVLSRCPTDNQAPIESLE